MIDLQASPDATVMDPQAVTLGRAYALALADYVTDADSLTQITDELRATAQLIRQTPGCREFLAATMMNRSQRQEMVERIFKGRVSKPLEMLLGVMAVNGRLGLIEAVADQFEKVLDRRAGRIDVTVTSAVELGDAERQQLRKILAEVFNAEPALHMNVDEEIIGGIVVKVGDTVYDGSVVGELNRMVEAMAGK